MLSTYLHQSLEYGSTQKLIGIGHHSQHLANIPSVPLDKLYKQMITSKGPVNPFLSTDESTGETISVWTLFSHAGVYVTV